MPFKVKEILLIANYYDSYTIEREGQFSGKIFGEYLQLNLFAAPRFTSVANEEGALHELKKRHFDLIIIMAGLDKETPILTSRHIKELYPDICQLMLVNNNADLSYLLSSEKEISKSIERVFVWNGSTKVFLAMAKYLEDKINLEADTKLGDVRVILVVEDSVKYYSRYLPLLYTEIMSQTHIDLFADVDVIQVGARNMQNFRLLKALGKINKPILLKRGLSATIEEWLMSAEYVLAGGNPNVILCERGIRTFEKMIRNNLDISAVPLIKQKSHLPVIIDPSHAAGIAWMVQPLARTAIAAGADGLMIEVHNNPKAALCDGAQSLDPKQFDTLMIDVKRRVAFEEKTLL